MRHEMITWQNSLSQNMDDSNNLDANCNIPKIHFISHSVQQISLYQALQQFPPQRNTETHHMNLRDGSNSSNHNLNYLTQVIILQHRIVCIEVRDLNLQTVTQCQENRTAIWKVLSSAADLAATSAICMLVTGRLQQCLRGCGV
jgi:hypothetical protein